jgi:hypothetical protein
MSNTITLPDHISFEEIALKWCSLSVWKERGFYFYQSKKKQKLSICFREYEEDCGESVYAGEVAEFYPSDRTIIIHDEEKFQPILNFIKERSHG